MNALRPCLVAVTVLCLLALGCGGGNVTGPGDQDLCLTDKDCPDGFTCNASHLCIALIDGDEGEIPADLDPDWPDLPPSLQCDDAVDFGAVPLHRHQEKTLVIANQGQGPLTIVSFTVELGGEEFVIVTGPAENQVVGPGASLEVVLRYTPRDLGADTGLARLLTNDPGDPDHVVNLTSQYRGDTSLAVAPGSLDFGTVRLDTTSEPRCLTLTTQTGDDGNRAVTILGVSMESGETGLYTLTEALGEGLPVSPAQTEQLCLTFRPRDRGSFLDSLIITHDATDTQSPLTVLLNGSGGSGLLGVSPGDLAFGAVEVGSPKDLPLTISNEGEFDLVVATVTVTAGGDYFAITDITPAASQGYWTLAPGDTLAVTVRFLPTANGGVQGSIVVESGDPVTPVRTVNVSGSGLNAGLIITPPVLTFDDLSVGLNAQKSLNFRKFDSMTETLTIQGFMIYDVKLNGQFYSGQEPFVVTSPSSLPLALPDSQAKSLSFTFNARAEGAFTAKATVNTTPTLDPAPGFTISGRGIAAHLGTSLPLDEPLSFGLVRVGETVTRTITLENTGQGILSVSGLGLGSQSFESFCIDSPEASAFDLEAGHTMDVVVGLAPSDPGHAGPRTGSLNFATTDPAHLGVRIDLEGEVVHPVVLVEPAHEPYLNLGNVTLGTTSDWLVVTVTGHPDSVGPLVIDAIDIDAEADEGYQFDGLADLDFPVTLTTGGKGVTPGSITFRVRYDSYAEGVFFAGLTVESNDLNTPSLPVSLRVSVNNCASNQVLCGGQCVTAGTGEHCLGEDGCGPCPGFESSDPHGHAACSVHGGAGSCMLACDAPFEDCNGGYADGCEADLSSDIQHCGDCDTDCQGPDGGLALCVNRQCDYSCTANHCKVDGLCVPDATHNLVQWCQVCDAIRAPEAWTALNDLTACDDGLFCTVEERCHGGVCGGATPRDCSQEVSLSEPQCQKAACDEDNDRCVAAADRQGLDCQSAGLGDGWYEYGDDGPGCLVMNDPVATYRDYACQDGACSHSVTQTRDCNTLDGSFQGGGDNPGCGADPEGMTLDYHADESGQCVASDEGCQSAGCDHLDICQQTCHEGKVVAYLDYHAPTDGGSTCLASAGSVVEDCGAKPSDDTDGAPDAYTTGGTVTIYGGCQDGQCTGDTYADFCLGNAVVEYGVVDNHLAGPASHDCTLEEALYCGVDGRTLYRDRYRCTGTPGFCSSDAPDTYEADCGQNQCMGVCGQGPNSCTFHHQTCVTDHCVDETHNNDDGRVYCEGCGLAWALGGEVALDTCCGDDTGEYARNCTDHSDNGDCGTDTRACCNKTDDCVTHQGMCAPSGYCQAFGGAGNVSFCEAGAWEDPDSSQTRCQATGCSYAWLEMVIGTNKCCGDDKNEDLEQAAGPGRPCCYNGTLLLSGASRNSVLCYNGQLFDCNDQASDESDLASIYASCQGVGGWYCGQDNLWSATLFNGCLCTLDDQCKSAHCAFDFSGGDGWCQSAGECAHEGHATAAGQYAAQCYSATQAAKCTSGQWVLETCGGASGDCVQSACQNGQCATTYHGVNHLCNSQEVCSTGPGDGNYALGGEYLCQGYCDGEGHCDYAGNCELCADATGWYGTGDQGPGCLAMNDPMANYRNYWCMEESCIFTVEETKDCDNLDGAYLGGGDNAGCGADPDSVKQDYHVGTDGVCEVITDHCQHVNCDSQDQCAPRCDGANLVAYLDYYVEANTTTCKSQAGYLLENCLTKEGQDSDGAADAYMTGGAVTDYTGCSQGACATTTYNDYCAGSSVMEYGVNGAAVVGPTAHNCKLHETLYCDETSRYLYRDIWGCSGTPAYCSNSAMDNLDTDCGINSCQGACASGENGCTYHLRGCSLATCVDQTYDPDQAQLYCTGCSLSWAAGGDVAATSCCGDDSGEFPRTCQVSNLNASCGTDTTACCTASLSCVDYNGACRTTSQCHAFGASGQPAYCNSGTWRDPDDSQDFCAAQGCGYTWLGYVASDKKCCGDDVGEDLEQYAAANRSCCYNAQALASGASSGAVLCYNGLLYNCNGLAQDHSGLAEETPLYGRVGSLYCDSDNAWKSQVAPGVACVNNGQCQSYACKADHDGVGAWCATTSQCTHDGVIYSHNEYSPVCFDSGNKARCNNGAWVSSACGVPTSCTYAVCTDGVCSMANHTTSHLCNAGYACSSGQGDNKYNVGGRYLCQGYCDGAGNCDNAQECNDCVDDVVRGSGTCTGGSMGSCVVDYCDSGYADCDTDHTVCEKNLATTAGYEGSEDLGSHVGNQEFYCFPLEEDRCVLGPARNGLGSYWYKINVYDDSSCHDPCVCGSASRCRQGPTTTCTSTPAPPPHRWAVPPAGPGCRRRSTPTGIGAAIRTYGWRCGLSAATPVTSGSCRPSWAAPTVGMTNSWGWGVRRFFATRRILPSVSLTWSPLLAKIILPGA